MGKLRNATTDSVGDEGQAPKVTGDEPWASGDVMVFLQGSGTSFTVHGIKSQTDIHDRPV